MSATSEMLMEQLRQIDEQIATLEASGGDTSGLRKSREKINEQFRAATHALNEGRTTVLKAKKMSAQLVDLYQPLINSRVGPGPLVLRVGITTSAGSMQGGVPGVTKAESYVLLSVLPTELQERIRAAIQMLSNV